MAVAEQGMPKGPAGFNTKIVGRVQPVKHFVSKSSVEKLAMDRSIKKQEPEKGSETTEKVSALSPFVKRMGVVSALGAAASIGSIGAGKLSQMIGNVLDKPKYEAAFKRAIELSPSLKSKGEAVLRPYFEVIVESSPSVAKNPLVLANSLEYMVDSNNHMNLSAYTDLVNLEGKVLQNNEKRHALANSVIKGVSDGVTKGVFMTR